MGIFIADFDHADILNPILREKGIRSLLGIPLILEGELIGVLHVGSLRPRVFDLRALAVLDLAAARAAPAIERAKLLDAVEREHRDAVMLQRSLLPRRFGAVQGVTVAARYLPARDEVGGDWYDMIQLPHGQAGIVIGDVAGHGLVAATLMGQLRTALHAYALAGHSPAQTLRLVDYFVGSLEEEVMASAALAVVDQEKGVVTFASAGHLPPILLSSDGRARAVEIALAPPLGAFGFKECPEHELPLGPGEMMMLYTDGLIERRGVALDQHRYIGRRRHGRPQPRRRLPDGHGSARAAPRSDRRRRRDCGSERPGASRAGIGAAGATPRRLRVCGRR